MENQARNWKTIKSKIVYQNPWIKVREDSVIRPDGKKSIYGFLEKYPGVFIIALDSDNPIFFNEEYRYPLKKLIRKNKIECGLTLASLNLFFINEENDYIQI